jgi:hypothetical protein
MAVVFLFQPHSSIVPNLTNISAALSLLRATLSASLSVLCVSALSLVFSPYFFTSPLLSFLQ